MKFEDQQYFESKYKSERIDPRNFNIRNMGKIPENRNDYKYSLAYILFYSLLNEHHLGYDNSVEGSATKKLCRKNKE